MELGTQQLHCRGAEVFLGEFISRIATKNSSLRNAPGIPLTRAQGNGSRWIPVENSSKPAATSTPHSIFSKLKTTILFDLNRQEPPAEMRNRYDLVTNFGTTEHIVNSILRSRRCTSLRRLAHHVSTSCR
jgi:hypothetical protein